MKKVLFINGCVRQDQSRTLQLAKTYLQTLPLDVEVVERNLMASNLRFLTATDFDPETGAPHPQDITLAQEFAMADEIVLAAPFWEFLFPAMVGCYFEMVSQVGTTFCYTETGSQGLCKGEKFTYFYTVGDYLKEGEAICEDYLRRLTQLYGIQSFTAISAQGLDIATNDAQAIVDAVCANIKGNE